MIEQYCYRISKYFDIKLKNIFLKLQFFFLLLSKIASIYRRLPVTLIRFDLNIFVRLVRAVYKLDKLYVIINNDTLG